MKVISLITIFVFSVLTAVSQVKVTGQVTNYSENRLDNPVINIVDTETEKSVEIKASGGKYKTNLEIDKVYRVAFSSAGYFTKYVMIDTKGIPMGQKIHMYIDMSLINVDTGLDPSLFERPMGIARYRAESEDMTWDIIYSRKRMKTIEAALKEAKKNPPPQKKKEPVIKEVVVPALKNPMEIAKPMQGVLQNYSLGKAYPKGIFKGYAYLGMVLAEVELKSNVLGSSDIAPVFESLSSALNAADLGGIKLEDHKKYLAENIQKSRVESVIGEIYKQSLDSAEFKGYYQAKDMMMAGAWLEVMWRALNNYNEKPSAEVNQFIGEQRYQLEAIVQRLNQYSKQMTDHESSFVSDLENLVPILSKIQPVSEQIQSDKNLKYDLSKNTIESLMQGVEKIRSAALR